MQPVDLQDRLFEECRAISAFLTAQTKDGYRADAIRASLAEDLLWRSRRLQGARKIAILEGLYGLIPSHLREKFPQTTLGLDTAPTDLVGQLRTHRDVAIVCPLDVELEAMRAALGASETSTELGGMKTWDVELDRVSRTSLRVIVTSIGRARNVPAALHVSRLLKRVDADLVLLVGIAAGPSDKVKLVDVIAGVGVYDYEHVRSELRRGHVLELPRPFTADMDDEQMRSDLGRLERHHSEQAKSLFVDLVRQAAARNETDARTDVRMEIQLGVIASGERLLADGSLRRMRLKFNERIRAGDQECSGFVQACVAGDARWAVFRGIADFGDPKKSDKEHVRASIAAAATATTFLIHTYTAPSDVTSW
jgi:nucleoside phosphorylase